MVGDLFITSLVIFPFVLVVGYLVQNLLWGRDLGPFTIIVKILAFAGVFFHEISHYILMLLTGGSPQHIKVRLRNEDTGRVNPHGSVSLKRPYQETFLQAVLGGLGPVLIGAWIIYFSLQISLSSLFEPIFRIIAGLMVISVFIASTPSPQDFRLMKVGFNHDPRHSFYQLILVTVSILLTWGIVNLFNIFLPIEFLYYLIIILCYIILKYSFIGVHWGINRIQTRFGKEQYRKKFRQFSRRRYKSLKFK